MPQKDGSVPVALPWSHQERVLHLPSPAVWATVLWLAPVWDELSFREQVCALRRLLAKSPQAWGLSQDQRCPSGHTFYY